MVDIAHVTDVLGKPLIDLCETINDGKRTLVDAHNLNDAVYAIRELLGSIEKLVVVIIREQQSHVETIRDLGEIKNPKICDESGADVARRDIKL